MYQEPTINHGQIIRFPNLSRLKSCSGITLIELLLVIALVAILAASSTPFLSRFLIAANFDNTLDKLEGAIVRSQSRAMDGKDDQTWGVCLSGSDIRVYSGSCATPVTSEDFAVPESIDIADLNDTTFNDRGEPSGTLAVKVCSDIESKTLSLNQGGGVDTAQGGSCGGGGGGGGGGTVVCTELYDQGRLSERVYKGDTLAGVLLQQADPMLMKGYRSWGRPLAKTMSQSEILTNAVEVLAAPAARQLAYETGVVDKGSVVGKGVLLVGAPMSRQLGYILTILENL